MFRFPTKISFFLARLSDTFRRLISSRKPTVLPEVFGKDLKEFTETDSIVTALYKKPTTIYNSYSSYKIAYEKVNLGISLIKPISDGYTITSRFGSRWGTTHTGLDVAAPMGTNIVAAAAGTVTRSTAQVDSAGNYSGYGEYIVISHGNGIQTLYGHCSARYVSEGQYVEQGQLIGAVGSTGKSTGPHLHLEIRINGWEKMGVKGYYTTVLFVLF